MKDEKSNEEKTLARLLLITTLLNLIDALIKVVNHFLE